MLSEIEGIVKNIVAQPLTKTESDLNALAAANPKDPGPLLASVIITSFAQSERFKDAQAILAKAKPLISTNASDAEAAFSNALYEALDAQFALFEFVRPGTKVPANPAAEQKAATALTALRAAAARNQSSSVAQTITALLFAIGRSSQANFTTGVNLLNGLSNQGNTRDLATFFLVYAHRRAGQYPQAISVAQQLETRNPNSAMVKRVIGSCYFLTNDMANAEKYFKQALALSPQDPGINLSLAQVYAKTGNAALARQYASDADKFDTAKRLTTFIKPLNAA